MLPSVPRAQKTNYFGVIGGAVLLLLGLMTYLVADAMLAPEPAAFALRDPDAFYVGYVGGPPDGDALSFHATTHERGGVVSVTIYQDDAEVGAVRVPNGAQRVWPLPEGAAGLYRIVAQFEEQDAPRPVQHWAWVGEVTVLTAPSLSGLLEQMEARIVEARSA